MCFHIKTSTSMGIQHQIEGLLRRSDVHLDIPVPTPLKIHHSIYDAVHGLSMLRISLWEYGMSQSVFLTLEFHMT